MLHKLFGFTRKKTTPDAAPVRIHFGRYSDNNKSSAKTQRWNDADALFKEKKYQESIAAFFDYLRDDEADNVQLGPAADNRQQFTLYQGSKIVRGSFDTNGLHAEVSLARMPQPSVPVMRRLLEHNFNLFYSRYALDDNRLCMRFDTGIETANPHKLYYALKELATRADKQDDLLVQDFNSLQPFDTDHIEAIPDAEKEVKYQFLQQWINETIQLVEPLDADKLSNGIAHVLLNLAYRIDYLLVPEGKLLFELEELVNRYFAKDDQPVVDKNKTLMQAFRKMASKSREEVFPHLYRSKHTFAITQPQQHKTISDTIFNANQNMVWFRDNSQPDVARQISEYGISYCQYNFSMPKPLTDLYQLLLRVIYSDFFVQLGFVQRLYDPATGVFQREVIETRIHTIIRNWKEKYPLLAFKTENLKYDSLLAFTHSFTAEMEFANTEVK